MTEILIQPLMAGDEASFAQAFAVYHDAIELSEQRTQANLRKLLLRPDYRFFVAKIDDRIVGMSVAYVPTQDHFWLFEYAAVAPEARGANIGAQMFLASRAIAGPGRFGLVEVDADRGSPEQARRLRFYKRLGCRRIDGLEYQLPLEDNGKPPEMWLLALAAEGFDALDVNIIERWLRTIYEDVYAQRLDDARLAQMIDPLPDDVKLVAI
ncbi:MAG TPA: GNAT family N-acetyltransferase [Hyphomonadaceae bacterium]|jgi:ribosomal protein S18 acetylase RimI-like enzyme|nr:GNAT family N-acetyltransferase [Hyphomonadaceae bacterium]HPN05914.1 GNAT family N-acetyltransferase [Hyphomonadaceae bacterium]